MSTMVEDVGVRTQARRILIVDDTEDVRSLLRIKFSTQAGYTVVGEAVDGLDAVRQSKLLQPELVLLDMAMPGMDGLEALPLIRDAAPNARIVVLTGFHPEALEEQALAAGADRYVLKGSTMKQLVAIVDSVLSTA